MSYRRSADITALIAAATTSIDLSALYGTIPELNFSHQGVLWNTASIGVKTITGILRKDLMNATPRAFKLETNKVHDLVFRTILKVGTDTDSLFIVGHEV